MPESAPAASSSTADKAWIFAILLGCTAALWLFLLYPRLGIRDVDGYAYVMGARSLRIGTGYKSLTGEAFNHWPPGYSLLLSVFPDPLPAALVLNYFSFAATVALLFLLLRRYGWSWQAAAGLTVALASGFFRLVANIAHPDIMTYALFLAGLSLIGRERSRVFAALIWILLVPVKLIAVVFVPAALVADRLAAGRKWGSLARFYAPALIGLALSTGSVVAFNYLALGNWIPSSHESSSPAVFLAGARSFFSSIPRFFLFTWHGTLSNRFPRIAFPLCLLLAGGCLLTLRPHPEGRWLRVYGAACLVLSALLLCVRSYDPGTRLTGYGLIVLLIGFRPLQRANKLWMLYGIVSLGVGTVNALTVNSLGSNDPRYVALANQFGSWYKGSGIVATNSFHILDIHANIPSVSVADYVEADAYREFLRVTLPQFDPGASSVTPMPPPGPAWCKEKEFAGAEFFRKCKTPQ